MTTNYIYDHEGIRVEKQSPSIHAIFVDKYAEIVNGSPIYHIFLENKRVASINLSDELEHIHHDHLGSTVLRTTTTASVSYGQKVFPFGEERSSAGNLSGLFNLYTDQYFDSESDLYYYKQRYYSQKLGRFISADPLYVAEMEERGMTPDELNTFAYVGNNPMTRIDPTGEFFENFSSYLGETGGPSALTDFTRADQNFETGMKQGIKVMGKAVAIPLEFTPANNLMRGFVGVDPLDDFSEVSTSDRQKAILKAGADVSVGVIGKIGTKAYKAFEKGYEAIDNILNMDAVLNSVTIQNSESVSTGGEGEGKE